jgi:hypothetical protein
MTSAIGCIPSTQCLRLLPSSRVMHPPMFGDVSRNPPRLVPGEQLGRHCPLYPQKRTLRNTIGMSAMCQEQTYAMRKKRLLNDLVSNQ